MDRIYNITQIKTIIENTINDKEKTLSGSIRTIGLRKKIEKRKAKLVECLKILNGNTEKGEKKFICTRKKMCISKSQKTNACSWELPCEHKQIDF